MICRNLISKAMQIFGTDNNDTLYGTSENDSIHGRDGKDLIEGRKGDDEIYGGSNNDSLFGGEGNDSLVGDNGIDTLEGGLGNDFIYGGERAQDYIAYKNASGSVTVDLDLGVSSGSAGNDAIVAIENIVGSDFDDKLFGSIAANIINAQQGNDLVDARDGDDSVKGGMGDDSLRGGDGNDTLVGGDGNDTLVGIGNGSGKNTIDTLIGSGGSDLVILGLEGVVLYNDADGSTGGTSDYAIVNFDISEDTIQLSGSSNQYVLGTSPVSDINDVGIFLDTNQDRLLNSKDELIAIVQNTPDLSLDSNYFKYV